MTPQKIDLALAFLRSRPGPAARILEQQPLAEVAAFLKNVPPSQAAPVLGKMLPQYTARLCKTIEPSIAAGFFLELETNLIAAILRYSENDSRKPLLDLLPEKTKLACNLLLRYSEGAVGAWMVSQINNLPLDCTVEEALSRTASARGVADLDTLGVVDRDRQLRGIVSLASLLRSPPKTCLADVMAKAPETVSGRMALISAKKHPGWNHADMIPVVNRHHQLVGFLRHVDLRKGLHQTAPTITKPTGGDPITGIFEVYGGTLLALFNSVGEMASINKAQRE